MVRYLILTLLSFYVIAGLFVTPFHGDESQHLALSRDYVAYFVIGDPWRLRVDPPVPIHSEAYLRLLDGTLSAYLTGFILWHTGHMSLDNPHPAWYYPDDVAANRAAGRYPAPDLLHWGRLASALFTAAGVWVMDALGKKLRSPTAGLGAAAMFALHPLILLNGRRVMQEGALMLFSLLVVWLGIRFAEKPSFQNSLLWGMVGGLALASKPTAIITLIGVGMGVLGGILTSPPSPLSKGEGEPEKKPSPPKVAEPTMAKEAPLFWRGVGVRYYLLAVIIAIPIYLILTPATWTDPPARLWLAAQMRREALAGQTAASGDGYETLWEGGQALFTMPFPAAIQYYESDDFAQDVDLQQEIRHYQAHWLRGLGLPAWLGMSLVVLGLVFTSPPSPLSKDDGESAPPLPPSPSVIEQPLPKKAPLLWRVVGVRLITSPSPVTLILGGWLLISALVTFLAVPLAWQRYYIPYLLPLILLAGFGLDTLWQVSRRMYSLRFHHAS
jgi:hypothetical protein